MAERALVRMPGQGLDALADRTLAGRIRRPGTTLRVARDGPADARDLAGALALARARADAPEPVSLILVGPGVYPGGFDIDLPLTIVGDARDMPFIHPTPRDPVRIVAPATRIVGVGFSDAGYDDADRWRRHDPDWEDDLRPILEVAAGPVVLDRVVFRRVMDGALWLRPGSEATLTGVSEGPSTRFDVVVEGGRAILDRVAVTGLAAWGEQADVHVARSELVRMYVSAGAETTVDDTLFATRDVDEGSPAGDPGIGVRVIAFEAGTRLRLRNSRIRGRPDALGPMISASEGAWVALVHCRVAPDDAGPADPPAGVAVPPGLVTAWGVGTRLELLECDVRPAGEPFRRAVVFAGDGARASVRASRIEGACTSTGATTVLEITDPRGSRGVDPA